MKRPRRQRTSKPTRLWLVVLLVPLLLLTSSLCGCHAASAPLSSSSSSSCHRRWVSIASPPTARRRRANYYRNKRNSKGGNSNNNNNAEYHWDLVLPSSHRSLGVWTRPAATTTAPRWLSPRPAQASTTTTTTTTASTTTTGDFPDQSDEEAFAQLGPIGKVVAGTIEIAVSTLLEYISGFLGGYALGTITGLPALIMKPAENAVQRNFWSQVSQRAVRMHGKSARWARSWGGISAAFGGFRVTTKVLRGGKEDEWSTIFSSMAAGAYFARKEGPQAMLRGAVVYGGIMYLLSGNLMEKKKPFQYTEETIDF